MKITAKKLLNEETKKDFDRTNQYEELNFHYGQFDVEIDLPSGNQIRCVVDVYFNASSDPSEHDESGYMSYGGRFDLEGVSWKFVENSDLIWSEYVNSGDFNENEYENFYWLINSHVENHLESDSSGCEEIFNDTINEYDGE